jgi:Protein of unknown function (DUF3347)
MKTNLLKTVLWLTLAGAIGFAPVLATDVGTSSDSAQPVYEHYLKIQTALADDSLNGVAENAAAIAKAVRQSADQHWPDQLAAQSEVLAKRTGLDAARDAFKLVSKSLIKHWAAHEALASQCQRAYCPMAKAAWLQAGSEIRNPYFGKAMLSCGTFLPRAQAQSSTSAVCPVNPNMTCRGGEDMNCTGAPAGCCGN